MLNKMHAKTLSALLLVLAWLAIPNLAYANQSINTIYLVRHAEKQATKSDPQLTACGSARADSLAKQLELVSLDHIFSTDFQRTIDTAKPTSIQQQVKIESYDAKQLEEVANYLKQLSGNILVVGHSNTTAVLAGLLADKALGAFDESIYDRLYQVSLLNGQAKLQVLQQNFQCSI